LGASLAYISEDSILEVKRASEIVDVVSRYIALKRAGSGYKALCPFHQEKTPSFSVYPPKQVFRCFGCGKAGGVIDFVKEMEKVEFGDAVRILAERAGVRLRFQGGDSKKEYVRDTVYKINKWAADQYNQVLKGLAEESPARQLAVARKLTAETIDMFQLGAAPESWDWLLRQAGRFGIEEQQLVEAGLAVRNQERVYDRFRNRFMIPIMDGSSRVVAFGARALSKEEQAKYINSPETAVFSKSRTFYGMNLVKGCETISVVEGYFDVIVPYQHGVKGLVATLGTALTRDHLTALRRIARKVNLVFDPDEAGQKAALRGVEMLLGEDLDAGVCSLSQDPDDIVLKDGPDGLRAALDKPRDLFEFMVEGLSKEYDPRSEGGRHRLIDALLEKVLQISKETLREIWVGRISSRIGVSIRSLEERMKVFQVSRTAGEAHKPLSAPLGVEARLVRELIECVCLDNSLAEKVREFGLEKLPYVAGRVVFLKIFELLTHGKGFDASDLLAFFAEEGEARELLLGASKNMEESSFAQAQDPELCRRRFEQALSGCESRRTSRKVEELQASLGAKWNENDFMELSRLLASQKRSGRQAGES
jgi:DNA primase